MATLRSNLPSRLRHLIAEENTFGGPSIKLDSEPPPKVKAFIDKVIQSPLQEIAIPLSGFRWEYSKGNFHHWRPLFLHFDKYFKTYLSTRGDLLLSDGVLEDNSQFPKHDILLILHVMQIILENCPNKSSFDGLEHFKLLLASTDADVLVGTLETLAALVKITPSKLHGSGKLVGCGSVSKYLLSLAQGWGSKEEGLGLYSCIVANERTQEGSSLFKCDAENQNDRAQYRVGSTLYFEFHEHNHREKSGSDAVTSKLKVIQIPDLHLRKEDDLCLMRQYKEQYQVPPELRFALLTRIRYAHAFRSPIICRLYSSICLLAFIVLVQSSDAGEELASFFANEPEHTNELIRIVRSEQAVPGNIRTLAMLALRAQLAAYTSSHERARVLNGSNISFVGGNRIILLNVLQKAIMSLNNSSDLSSLAFVEALLQFYLLHVVSTSTTGSSLRGSGMVPTFLPLLEDSNPSHLHLICLAVKTLQKLMDYSSSAVSTFKELGGVELLAQRLQVEVLRVIDCASRCESLITTDDYSKKTEEHADLQRRLIKVLLKALGSATYSPRDAARSQRADKLPATLSIILGNVDKFGGDIYFSAVTVMSEMIHKDPNCFSVLHEMGLPDAFLSTVVSGVLPSSKAITCVPSGLGAICLNAKGLESVKETSALRFLVDVLTSKKYAIAMNEAIVPLANAFEELLRHVSSLRGTGIELVIEIIGKITALEDSTSTRAPEIGTSGTKMELDSEDKGNDLSCSLIRDGVLGTEEISNEQFMQLGIFYLLVLLHRMMENSETCRLFVEKSGIDALLKLLLRPSVVQSSEGMSIALHSTMVFKGFTQLHSAPLARAFCSSLREHLTKVLAEISSVSRAFWLDSNTTLESGLFSSLFLVEFLLFLAASKDNRWVAALLTEFGSNSKDVVGDIGRLHREVLWQVALLEDSKHESEDVSCSGIESHQSGFSTTETGEQRFYSFRQILDPLLRNRPSWSIESQFFDLLNLYRDFGRTSTFQPRNVQGSPNLQSGNSQHVNQSTSSNDAGTDPNDYDRKRSIHSAYCSMVRSLTFHIIHLFQELGKTMLHPSHRRDDTLLVSTTSKSVASSFSTIALDHLNFSGHESPSGSEASVSTKCWYFGLVIDFIDSILQERPDSCNTVLLNCFYGHGVIQLILTTFEATSQLLSTVNRTHATPMETDRKQDRKGITEDNSWIDGPLVSYGKLMDHMVTSSFVLSPFTKHMLVPSLTNEDVPFPRDGEAFVKVLQSMVFKAILPVWNHPRFSLCSDNFIATAISIIKHIYLGVEVKDTNSNITSRIIGPPPNDLTITTIVEMGFPRARVEEALRQVGSNSVELAMEWLCSHPEETPEDDELARALAMSLGKSESKTQEDVANDSAQHHEEEMTQLPPVEELLSTCTRLLQTKESLVFPVRDLLVTMCSQNDGQNRSIIISFVIDQLKDCHSGLNSENNTLLSALLHVIALVFLEDPVARELALKNGLVKLVSDLLSEWELGVIDKGNIEVPRWITTAFLAIDRLLQTDQKVNSEILEELKKEGVNQQSALSIDEDKQRKLQSSFGSSTEHIEISEQKRLIEVSCMSIRNQLPAETMHAVLQLCSTLTRNHSIAVKFLDLGGLASLLSLPASSLFPGFDSIASAIIRHILEDPQTLQLAMESEIKHTLLANRHSNGRVSPRNFLLKLNSVIIRDPVIFMLSAQNVCQVDVIGDRPYIVLRKDREKEKYKEKDREKNKEAEKEKPQSMERKAAAGDLNLPSPGSGRGKIHDANYKSSKVHRKTPQSFINVVELLMDSVAAFMPQVKKGMQVDAVPTDMDIDVTGGKGKGKAVAILSQDNEAGSHETSISLAKIALIIKLLKEILLMYTSSAHVLLRLDTEISSCRGLPQRASSGVCTAGLFHHVLHNFLPYARCSKKERKPDSDWRHKLATRTNQFLVAACVRSTEARKRVFVEINSIFNEFVASCSGVRAPSTDLQAYVDLINDVFGSPTGLSITDVSATFIDVGLVKSFTQTLHVLDLDHSDSPKVVIGLVKALELVTRQHLADSNSTKGESSADHIEDNQAGVSNTGEPASQPPVEMLSPSNHNSLAPELSGLGEPFSTVPTFASEAVSDDMEDDQDLDGGLTPATEDDFMQEDARGNGGIDDVATIQFEIQPSVHESIVDGEDDDNDDDDDEMSDDDGDEVDEDEEDMEHNVLEEEVHFMPHPDTDQDDHDMDDEFDELLQEDEDDEDDEDRVILRLEDGINGINVLDEVFNRDHGFSNEPPHVMPVEIFGSRHQGRTTSISNLLGRSSESTVPSHHPLLMGPSLAARRSESSYDLLLTGQDIEGSSSTVDAIFRTLRNGRHGQRMDFWVQNLQGGGSNAATIPQGFDELLVSQLRRPDTGKPLAQTDKQDNQDEDSQLQASGAQERPETIVENHPSNETSDVLPSSSANDASRNAETRTAANVGPRGIDGSSTQTQAVEMQFEHGDVAVRDVEAVSQESGGSGATLGESLRSLDVEIGSADGHDDVGERQIPSDRMSMGDSLATRSRRNNVTFGSFAHASGREATLHSVMEVSENSSHEAEQDVQGADQQVSGDTGSGSIDPAFLEALPDELRVEVLSSQQGEVAQPSNAEQQNTDEIDPEFLAALPADIRAEVLAQQQAQRIMHQSQELEGQPVEMDAESIIATFPSELREEVLLMSSDAILANLTPALVAEANMLRERFANRFSNRAIFGMYSRGRRVDSSRRSEGISSLDRAARGGVSRRSAGERVTEAVGTPLVDSKALQGMVRLLRVLKPLYKGQLQSLLLNLCAHSETRTCLVKLLMNMLVPDKAKCCDTSCDNDSPFRLYACQSNVIWSHSELLNGVPPLVSRRVLETLIYLAKNHPHVAKILLQFRLSLTSPRAEENINQARDKAVMVDGELGSQQHHGYFPVALILGLLSKPLYLRSMAHLEQLLILLEVIIDHAESKASPTNKHEASTAEQSAPQVSSTNAMTTEFGGVSSDDIGISSKGGDMSKVLNSASNMECNSHAILLDLPRSELRLLCSLLAQEGLSDNAYMHLAEVLKKLTAIVPAHCHLFIAELAEAIHKLAKSAMNELRVFGETVDALLARTPSDGTAIVRVLLAVSSLVATLSAKDQPLLSDEDRSSALSQVSVINTALEPLWLELSSCISNVEQHSDCTSDLPMSSRALKSKRSSFVSPLPAGSQNILPYVESFFVTCEKLHPALTGSCHDFAFPTAAEEAGTSTGQQQIVGPAPKFDEKNIAFVKFCEKHRKLLNAFIRQNSGLLEKSFSLMLKIPRFIDFDNKRAHFRSKIKYQHNHHHSPLRISVRRAYILEDSYNQLRMRSAQELKGRLTVHFQGEEGIDAGGLAREWYQLLSRVIFDKGALLFTTVGNESTFQPNPNSVYQTEHLSYFKFVGRVVGKALFDGQLLDVHFTRSFYKHMLGAKVTYLDIEAIDPDYYKNLKWMLENDISDVLDLTFSIDADEEKLILYERTEVTDYELIPGGRNIKVTEENKHQYVDLVTEHRLTTAIRPQINAFLEGFNDLIPRELISIFHDKELELLISGLPDIDLDDLRVNTEYSGYSAGSPIIQWFWEVVQIFSKEDKARLLQFVTGTSKVPLEGFSALQGISRSQKFQIHKAYGSPDHLPSAHTCFNQLDLPEYPSKEHLEERLLLAIHEANEGFGFG